MDENSNYNHEEPIEEIPAENVAIEFELGGAQPASDHLDDPLTNPAIESCPSPSFESLQHEETASDIYNQGLDEEDGKHELGSCDCRSECKFNTGSSYKYAEYGYSS